ncbi:lipid-A-disaccharide synthase [Cognatiluteimonas weifangensis]|uniref:Lipid-A-disaccharide synthase n=1 Tax=Cognatiluteimonas weifangensis TaxID=2303539 RepID=A0A372DRS6_9GAMM|nr:lipid-A-disaccharide synthase [Luteimonas weifangensis]RFP62268.1 lipid-A-disaccharide synthase [Luteimonas weifangensis]
MRPGPVRIALCAGEASGDQLGAGLVAALRARCPGAQFAGIGGDAMRAAGVDTWHDAGELAVMGLAEVLRHLPRLLRLRRELRERTLAWRPDVFVGIDAPDFNLGVERWLKRRGVRTVHYVSPSVWAWRESRAERIGRSADRVLCLFPMEPAIYARHGVDARFVGHPLADAIALEPDRAGVRTALGVAFHDPVLALLPGSRLGEIERMLPLFLQAAALIAREIPELQLLLPAANAACRAAIQSQVSAAAYPPARVRILDGQAQAAMIAADVVLLASGTAALEAMLCKRPMVIGHRIAPASYRIVKTLGLLKSRFVGLPNVLAGEELVPELLQDACTPQNLAAAVLQWFAQPEAVAALRPRFRALHESLRRDASAHAAAAVLELPGDAGTRQSGTAALP